MSDPVYAGMPLDRKALDALKKEPAFSMTRGQSPHYLLEEDAFYLVRKGARPAAMPRMAYGDSVKAALAKRENAGKNTGDPYQQI